MFCSTGGVSGPGPQPDPFWIEAYSPNLFLFCSCSPGTRAFTHYPLGGVGPQQEVDFARDQKRELGVSVEGRSLDCIENIRGVDGVPRADTAFPHLWEEG